MHPTKKDIGQQLGFFLALPCARIAFPHAFTQERNRIDLYCSKQIPVNTTRAWIDRAGGNDVFGGNDKINWDIVGKHRDFRQHKLQWVDGRNNWSQFADSAFFT